jgi:transcriptional regulator with GAF, ATPase, and Fis domain
MDFYDENYELVGASQNIRRIRELIGQVAETGFNVLVCGETGVGKELVVANLYRRSDRLGQPFIKVNCAALPDTLLESEMFGYERGAFTGAIRTRRGKFEQASGGVLFLDEIGDMSLPLQSKLLHVLQGGDFTPLGSEKPLQADVWVIAATNHDLEREVERGQFRDDLYYRLSTVRISVAPLRNRPEDVPLLIDYYIKKYVQRFKGTLAPVPSPEALAKMAAYPWPGNVRELQNVLQRVIVLGESVEALDAMLTAAATSPAGARGRARGGGSSLLMRMLAAHGGDVDLADLALKEIRKKAIDQAERELISFVLAKTGWNRSKASRILKVSYKTMLQKIEELAIVPPSELA